MAFRIKNISKFPIKALDQTLNPNASVDLLLTNSIDTVKSSILQGELYHKIQGRMLSVLSPPQDWDKLGLSVEEIARLMHAGFFKGYLGLEDLKPPFNFDGYGSLVVSTVGSGGSGSSITVEGGVADGDAAIDNPITIAGVDSDGNVQAISVTTDGEVSIESKVYDPATDADRIIPVYLSQDRYVFEDRSGSQADSDDTLSYYIDMQGFSYFSLQYIPGGDGTKTLKIYVSNEDVEDMSTATYTDVTADFFGSASFTSEKYLEKDTTTSCKGLRVDVAATGLGGGDTATWSLFVSKKTA